MGRSLLYYAFLQIIRILDGLLVGIFAATCIAAKGIGFDSLLFHPLTSPWVDFHRPAKE